MKALSPLYEAFILFGLLEEALPAQYAPAFHPKSPIVTFSAF
jgi:hypothetical protein